MNTVKHLVLAAGVCLSMLASAVEITKDWQIVVGKGDSEGLRAAYRLAAEEIQRDVQRAVGFTLPIVSSDTRETGRPSLSIGAEFARAAGFDFTDYLFWQNAYAEKGGNLYFFGNDRSLSPQTTAAHKCLTPSVRAVTRFLEDCVGVRFVMPGPVGTAVPKRAKIELADGALNFERQRLTYCGNYPRYASVNLYWIANGCFLPATELNYGGHSFCHACPNSLFKEHPEYFGLTVGGKRRIDSTGGPLCISNPEVRNLIFQEAKKQFEAGADICQVGHPDGPVRCYCPACKDLYGTGDDWGEKFWCLYREIAERAERECPGKILHFMSYGCNRRPPKTFNAFPKNTMVMLCHYGPELLEAWSHVDVPQGFSCYLYFWGNYQRCGYVTRHSYDFLVTQARNFIKYNIRGLYRCGHDDLPGTEGPGYYLFNRLMANPDLSVEGTLADYMRAAFGPAAASMTRFFDEQDRRARYNDILCAAENIADDPRRHFEPSSQELHALLYPPESVALREDALAAAEATPGLSDEEKLRLKLVRREFEYAKVMGRIANLHRAYRVAPSKELFAPLAEAIEARNSLLDELFDEKGEQIPLDGWPESSIFGGARRNLVMTNGRSVMGAPLNWDVARMRANGVLPGLARKSVKAVRAETKPTGFDFESGVWTKAAWQELGGVQMEEPQIAAKFKVVYDDEAVYLAFETPMDEAIPTPVLDRDSGKIIEEESFDIFFSPMASKAVQYQMIFTPEPKSQFDGGYGLHTDPLDPKLGKYDIDWNGGWSTASEHRDGVWRAVLTLPYKAFNVKAPSSGEKWWLNVGRAESRFSTSEIRKLSYALVRHSLWSPNMESNTFCSPEAMGALVFE